MRDVDALIIGAGPAGCAAAIQLHRLGYSIALVDRSGGAGGLVINARLVENLPILEKPVDGLTLARRLRDNLARFGIAVRKGHVTLLRRERQGRFLACEQDGSDTLRSKVVIAAVGTAPNPMLLDASKDIVREHVFHDLRHLLEASGHLHTVVIIGGGEAACDYALSLAEQDIAVHLVVRAPTLRAKGSLGAQALSHPNITAHFHSAVGSVRPGRDGVLIQIRGPAAQPPVVADALLVAIGRHPSRLDVQLEGGTPVDISEAHQHTPGLWLVGDARNGGLGQTGMAIGDGLNAAQQARTWLENTKCKS